MDRVVNLSLSKQRNKQSFSVLVDPGERTLITKLFSKQDWQYDLFHPIQNERQALFLNLSIVRCWQPGIKPCVGVGVKQKLSWKQ